MVHAGRDVAADQRVQRPETREVAGREQAKTVAGIGCKALDDRASRTQSTRQDVEHGAHYLLMDRTSEGTEFRADETQQSRAVDDDTDWVSDFSDKGAFGDVN